MGTPEYVIGPASYKNHENVFVIVIPISDTLHNVFYNIDKHRHALKIVFIHRDKLSPKYKSRAIYTHIFM